MITFTNNVRGGKALPLTPQELQRLRALDSVVKTSERLKEITKQMKQLEPTSNEYKLLDEEKRKIKISRPALIPHASAFDDMERKNDKAKPSGLVFFDVDHMEGDVRLWFEEKLRLRVAELRLALAEISPSGDGFHGYFVKPEGMTIPEAQEWFAKEVGVDFDGATFDLARCAFCVPEDFVLYQNDDLLFSEQTVPEEELPLYQNPEKRKKTSSNRISAALNPLNRSSAALNPLNPLNRSSAALNQAPALSPEVAERIFNLCVAEAGLKPENLDTIGSRHTNLMAVLSVGICQLLSKEQLLCVVEQKMPSYYNNEPADCQQLIADFYNNYVDANGRMTIALRNIYSKALRCASAKTIVDEEGGIVDEAESVVELPRLTRLLQLIVKAYPEDYRPAVLISALVFLGALMTRVRARYLDGSIHSTSFLGCVVAPQASGKSFTRRLYDILTAPIKASDAINREIERKYNEKRKSAKNKRDQPEDPRVKIRLIPATASNAMILKRADYANGEHLCTYAEEIDTLTKGQKAGAWSQKSDLYRMAFDNAEWGQDYMSDNSYSGQVKLFYNLLVCGTPNAVNRFFNDVEDGLVSRVMFTQLPDMMGCQMPRFGNYSHRDIREINSIVQKIYDENNTSYEDEERRAKAGDDENSFIWVKSKALEDSIYNWLEEKRLEYLQTQDNPALEIFRRRSAVIGFRAGLVAYILNDKRYTPQVSEFAVWVAEFVLQNQLALFGERMNQVMNKVEENKANSSINLSEHRGRNKDLFKSLPQCFNSTQISQKRLAMGLSGRVDYIIQRWQKNGWVERQPDGYWKKIV